MKAIRSVWLSAVLSMALSIPCTWAMSAVLTDDFNDNLTDLVLWAPFASGGPTVTEVNQRLEITMPATSSGQVFCAGYLSNTKLRGDFDIQVDYSLLNWPSASGVRVGLEVMSGGVLRSMQRGSYSSGEEHYLTHFSDGPHMSALTTHTSGKLRMTRVGTTLSGYYWNGSSWALAHAAVEGTGDVAVELGAWSHDYLFGDKETKIAFDDFAVNSGTVVPVPEPSGLLALACALGALSGMVWRKRR